MLEQLRRYEHLSERQWRRHSPYFVARPWPPAQFAKDTGAGALPPKVQEQSTESVEEINFSRPVESEVEVVIGATVNVIQWVVNSLRAEEDPEQPQLVAPSLRFVRGSTVFGIVKNASKLETMVSFKQMKRGLKNVYLEHGNSWQEIMEEVVMAMLRHCKRPSRRSIITDFNDWAFIDIETAMQGSVFYRIRWVKYDLACKDKVRTAVYGLVRSAAAISCQTTLFSDMEAYVNWYRVLRDHQYDSGPNHDVQELQRVSPKGASRRAYDDMPVLPAIIDYAEPNFQLEEVPSSILYDSGPMNSIFRRRLCRPRPEGQAAIRLVREISNDSGPHYVEKVYKTTTAFETEMAVYRKLSYLQGTTLPYVHAVVMTDPLNTHLGVRKPGVLLEYRWDSIPLRDWWRKPMSGLSGYWSPDELRQKVRQVITAAVETIHGEGIAHTQLVDHILVRPSDLQITIVSFTRATDSSQGIDHDLLDLAEFFGDDIDGDKLPPKFPAPMTRPHSGLARVASSRSATTSRHSSRSSQAA